MGWSSDQELICLIIKILQLSLKSLQYPTDQSKFYQDNTDLEMHQFVEGHMLILAAKQQPYFLENHGLID